ncbi:MAG: flagellar basal body P-ring protein FlgI [Fusobacteria bacterium]|jgi:flagellar P-ring protein precursor FlgI|nr:flagellar basal body P-ring protein FlgI [Fusobacteriota bacterium]
MKKIIIILLILLSVNIYGNQKVRLKEVSRVKGVRSNQLMGMGIVVGLSGNGDKSPLTPQLLKNLYSYFGTDIALSQIESKNVATVMVTAELPPFKKPGDTIDVMVSSVNDAKNLEGGVLLQTLLYGADGNVYVASQGSLTKVINETNNKVNGFIQNGGIVEKEVPLKLDYDDKVHLILNTPDFTTASRVVDEINKIFNFETAFALDASTILVNKTYVFSGDIVSFISLLENIEIIPDRKSQIVINERTGTIILGENIKIAPVAITHKDISISIAAELDVLKNNPNNKGDANSFYYDGGNTVKNIVKMLNAIGAGPNDIISILNALKYAGAIDAEIKTM